MCWDACHACFIFALDSLEHHDHDLEHDVRTHCTYALNIFHCLDILSLCSHAAQSM